MSIGYYTIEFARVLRGSSPDAAFAFLSGSGADPHPLSRFCRLFNCVKSAAVPISIDLPMEWLAEASNALW